mmetsp:Transcript_2332/g.5448  ORF Transcript_2332/g.5448 Transcript_2332/m.5448 type:complete len:312 (-) Transcript_2332:86-1021(-)
MVQARDGRELGVLEDNEQVKCIDDILAPLRDRTHFAACQTLPRLQQRQVMERDHRVDLCDKPRAHKLPRAIDRDLGDVQLSLQRELDKEGDGERVLAMQTNMHLYCPRVSRRGVGGLDVCFHGQQGARRSRLQARVEVDGHEVVDRGDSEVGEAGGTELVVVDLHPHAPAQTCEATGMLQDFDIQHKRQRPRGAVRSRHIDDGEVDGSLSDRHLHLPVAADGTQRDVAERDAVQSDHQLAPQGNRRVKGKRNLQRRPRGFADERTGHGGLTDVESFLVAQGEIASDDCRRRQKRVKDHLPPRVQLGVVKRD